MLIMRMKKWLLVLFILIPIAAHADLPLWNIDTKRSSLTFTATEDSTPITGQFNSFNGTIQFDPNQLDASKVAITVELASVSDIYNQLAKTLNTPDWFDVKNFPRAAFQATEFVSTGNNGFVAKGTLTIRDKTLPLLVPFTFNLVGNSGNKAEIKGSTTIKRTAYGIGHGEWADTKSLADEVVIDFDVMLTK